MDIDVPRALEHLDSIDQGLLAAAEQSAELRKALGAPPKLGDLPTILVHPPTPNGYGEAVRQHIALRNQELGRQAIAELAFVPDQYGAPNPKTGRGDLIFDDSDKESLDEILEQRVPLSPPALFLDMEKTDKPFKAGPDDVRQQVVNYRLEVVAYIRQQRKDLVGVPTLVWKAPHQEHDPERFDEEYRRVQGLWHPLIQIAGAATGRIFAHTNDVQQDLAWMVPYAQFVVELAEDLPVWLTHPPLTDVGLGHDPQYFRGVWEGLSGLGVGLNFSLPYKHVAEKRLLTPQEAILRDQYYIWAIDTALEIVS